MELELSKIHILLLESSPHVRRLLRNLLWNLGAKNVTVCSDVIRAVQILQQETSAVDLIISDLFMDPINGFALLEYVRSDVHSRNFFIPFIITSRYVDANIVRKAINMGVNEVIIKPFTLKCVQEKLSIVSNDVRHFVMTKNYFGPDRRRGETGKERENNRRRENDHHVTKISNLKQFKDLSSTFDFKKDQTIYLYMPNTVREKMAGSGVSNKTSFRFLPSNISKTQRFIQEAAKQFLTWAVKYIQKMDKEVNLLIKEMYLYDKTISSTKELNNLAKDVQELAGLFGEEQVVRVAEKISEISSYVVQQDKKTLLLIRSYLKLLHTLTEKDREMLTEEKLTELHKTLQLSIDSVFSAQNITREEILAQKEIEIEESTNNSIKELKKKLKDKEEEETSAIAQQWNEEISASPSLPQRVHTDNKIPNASKPFLRKERHTSQSIHSPFKEEIFLKEQAIPSPPQRNIDTNNQRISKNMEEKKSTLDTDELIKKNVNKAIQEKERKKSFFSFFR